MEIPCVKRIPFIVCGLSFLSGELTRLQYDNLTLIATALVLGAKFNLSEISRMWLKEKCVSTLSHFLSEAKFSTKEMWHLYALQVKTVYSIKDGYFLIDDTLSHHTDFCKWVHGVFVLFDHTLKTNLKAICIVFLYYTNGKSVNFPIAFRIFYKDTNVMKWQHSGTHKHKPKYTLATEMLRWALSVGFPRCVVLADSWFGIEPFIKELNNIGLSYVIEIKSNYTTKVACEIPKRTPTGRVAKKQYDSVRITEFFKNISTIVSCGFAAEQHKREKTVYHTKIATLRLNPISGKHRIVESIQVDTGSVKYLLSNELTWESVRILSAYHHRWRIEEFFRNAKQLSDMEGATVRSEQGVTTALCLVSWIDFLLHIESHKRGTAEKLTKESLTIPSIVRECQYENLKALAQKVREDKDYIPKWCQSVAKNIYRHRKTHNDLIEINKREIIPSNLAA